MNKQFSKLLNKVSDNVHASRYSKIVLVAVMMAPALSHAVPDSSIDPAATTVYLRTSCNIANVDGAGEGTIENCFESMSALKTWIYARVNPQKLLVDIGPGTFGSFICSLKPAGELSFRGAGTDKTIIDGIRNHACSNAKWTFSDLTVSTVMNAVQWLDAGSSSWNNVVLESTTASSWYDAGGSANSATGSLSDQPCAAGEQGTHRFTSVRFISSAATNTAEGGSIGFLNRCGDNWLWGSEIIFTPAPGGTGSAIVSNGPASRIHLYGSNVRAEANPAATSGAVTAFYVRDGAEVHAHGVGIDVIVNTGMTGTALDAASSGAIHANASSYAVSSSTGTTFRRIVNSGGHVHAPYFWEHIPAQTFESVTGADTATVMSGTSDGQPHLVIYSKTCLAGSPGWYDTTDKICRQ